MIHKNNPQALPTISVAIPTYNESVDIERIIRGFLSTKYPNLIEIFVADGGSTDATLKIVQSLSEKDSRVKLLHNPLKIQSVGLNIILRECQGEVFLRADAHSDYAPDYIERCVEALLKSDALNVGGAQRFVAKTPFQAGVALSSKSILGSGGAKYRNPEYNGYAETVYLGCFWKQALLEVSAYSIKTTLNEDYALNLTLVNYFFDITQVTNQDAEINQRLLSKSNKAIYISSKICVWYYPRTTWKSLVIQYFKYGRGRYLTTTKHSVKSQIRGIVPFVFICTATLMLLINLIFLHLGLPIKILVLFCLLLPFLESLRITIKFNKNFVAEIWRGDEDKIPSFISRCFFCGVTLLTMPLAHSCGYAYQLLRHQVFKISGW